MVAFALEPWHFALGLSVALMVRRTVSKNPITLGLSQRSDTVPDGSQPPLLRGLLPSLAQELQDLLVQQGEPGLAAQVPELRIVDRCRCEDDFCATFYVRRRPKGAYGPSHRNVSLEPNHGMLILDVVAGKIACVEVLCRDDVRRAIRAVLP